MTAPLRLCLTLALVGSASGSQTEPRPTIDIEQRVVALDVVVELERGLLRSWLGGRSPDLGPKGDQLQVLYGGEAQTLLAVESGRGTRGGGSAADWAFVLYFDLRLSTTRDVRWAATLLAEQATALAALGNVELVLADPDPRVLVAGRDAEQLEASLSRLALEGSGEDEIGELRLAFLDELGEGAEDPERLAELYARGERRLVAGQQDELLTFLHDRVSDRVSDGVSNRVSAVPRRALFLASSGFDLQPGRFYAAKVPAAATADLTAETDELARTLAAYGWSVFPLRRPDPELSKQRPGWRLGKLRLAPGIGILGFGASYEEDRNPKRADAYVELGGALARQGRPEEAEEAYRKALFHYYGDPRTADRQAAALNGLGESLERQGEAKAAAAAYRTAAELSPEKASQRLGALDVELLEPYRPLLVLAETSAGKLILDREPLPELLRELADRVLVTYQVAGLPDGRIRPLRLELEGRSARLRYPLWARSSTPKRVAAARLRRLLRGEELEGDLELVASFEAPSGVRASSTGEIAFELRVPAPEPGQPTGSGLSGALRVSWAAEAPDRLPVARHRLVEAVGRPPVWGHSFPWTLGEEETAIALVVEDLADGRFGAVVIDVTATGGIERRQR